MANDVRLDVRFDEIRAGDRKELEAWHKLYCQSFPHPDEQEPIEAFEKILQLNEDKALQTLLGPYREFVLAIRDTVTGRIVGGLNFGVAWSQYHIDAGVHASIQVIFLFVDEHMRDHLKLNRAILLEVLKQYALSANPPPISDPEPVIAIFFEANNPLRMKDEEVRQDIDNSGLDTYRRYYTWLGIAKRVAFHYLQPALDKSKTPVEFLDLFLYGKDDRLSLSSAMLQQHLFSFDSISVLKGEDARQNAEFQHMAQELSAHPTVELVDENHPDSVKIKNIYLARRPLPEVEELVAGDWFYELRNTAFRLLHRWNEVAEKNHSFLAGVESFFSILSLAWSAVQLFRATTLPLVEGFEALGEFFLALVLAVTLGFHAWTRWQRAATGQNFKKIMRMINPGPELPGRTARMQAWFRKQVLDTLDKVTKRESIWTDGTRTSQGLQGLICEGSAVAYAEEGEASDDARQAESALFSHLQSAYSDGAWITYLNGHTDRFFCDIILPLERGPRGRINLDDIRIDSAAARQMRPEARARKGDDADVTLLVLRQLTIVPGRGLRTRMSPMEIEFGLITTTLLRLAMMLERISFNGDLKEGLPPRCVIAVASTTESSHGLLKWLGFVEQKISASDYVHAKPPRTRLYVMPLDDGPNAQRLLDDLSAVNDKRRKRGLG